MTPADYAQLRSAIAPVWGKYQAEHGHSAERHRWDLLWASGYSVVPLYAYLNDDHIDTALRSIVRELEA